MVRASIEWRAANHLEVAAATIGDTVRVRTGTAT